MAPRGNLTGVFLDFPDFAAKCLQLLLETSPSLSGIGVLWDPTTGTLQLTAVRTARGQAAERRRGSVTFCNDLRRLFIQCKRPENINNLYPVVTSRRESKWGKRSQRLVAFSPAEAGH